MKPASFSGPKLQAARERANLTRAELAALVGISRQMVRYLEVGDNTPALELAWRIADALGVKVDSLRG